MRFYWLIFLTVLRDINSKTPTNYDSFKNALLCKYVTKSHENFAQIIILLLKSQKMQTFVLNRNVVEQSTDFLRKKCSGELSTFFCIFRFFGKGIIICAIFPSDLVAYLPGNANLKKMYSVLCTDGAGQP